MRENLGFKILITLVMVLVLSGIYLWLNQASNTEEVATDYPVGSIAFSLYNEDDSLLIDERLTIYESDTLYSVLSRNYDIVCANQQYQPDASCSYRFINGYVILAIEDVDSNWSDTVLSIYVNDQLSNYGVSMIELVDGDVITIRKTYANE